MIPTPLAIVTPVWGETYIRRFLDLVLPSWLAPGNLPAFRRTARPPMYFMTRARDTALLSQALGMARLTEHVEPRFIPIDDLIGPGSVPVTLTLAYQRGLSLAATEHGRAAVALLNADFLLADGSLRTLRQTLADGARVVLAPSLRAIEENLAGPLLAATRGGVLSIAPRRLVSLALEALHPTVICSRLDQTAFWSANPTQLFWRPTPDLLIGRPFCMFALALEVEHPVPATATYCDYGLVPQALPGVAPCVLNNSDAFLALELGPLEQELSFFQAGPPSPRVIAEKLSVWTTQFHRDQAGHAILYKAAEPPSDIEALVAATRPCLDEIAALWGPALPQDDHPNWLGGIGAWRVAREQRGVREDPPELAATRDIRVPPLRNQGRRRFRRLARAVLVGEAGSRALPHPYQRLDATIARRLRALPPGPLTVIGGETGAPITALAERPAGGAILVHLNLASPDHVAQILSALAGLADGTQVILAALDPDRDNIGESAVAALASRLDSAFKIDAVEALNLQLDRRVERAHGAMADLRGASPATTLRIAARSGIALAAMCLSNLGHALGYVTNRRGALTSVVLLCERRSRA